MQRAARRSRAAPLRTQWRLAVSATTFKRWRVLGGRGGAAFAESKYRSRGV